MYRLKDLDYPLILFVFLGLRVSFFQVSFAEAIGLGFLTALIAAREFYKHLERKHAAETELNSIKNDVEGLKASYTGLKMLANIKQTKPSVQAHPEKFWGV